MSEKTLGLIKKLLATSTSMYSQTLQKFTRHYEVLAVTKNKEKILKKPSPKQTFASKRTLKAQSMRIDLKDIELLDN